MTNEEASALELLLQRLTWPSGLVRERACVSLGSLMADVEFGEDTVSAVLEWIARQKLESVAVFGLLAFFQAKDHGVVIPTRDAVSQKLVKPSLLSWLIASSVYEENIEDPTVSEMHSETAPSGFEADPFFLRYATAFLPPVYMERARRLDVKYCPGFVAQWKFEWAKLVEATGFGLSRPDVNFWMRRDDEHLVCVDFPLSEVYRSAFLRGVAWAVDEGLISQSEGLWLSAATCPIDLGLWKVLPGRPPENWPKSCETRDPVDALPGELTTEIAHMWQRQNEAEWVIAEASGRVLESDNSAYDLEIIGVIQACEGPNSPRIDCICAEGSAGSIALSVDALLSFGGSYERERADNYRELQADWSIWRLAASASPAVVSRWQWWRHERGVWLPSPFLALKSFEFRCTQQGIAVKDGGHEVARWTDWTHQLREKTTANLRSSSGHMLVIHRSLIDRESAKLGGVFAWICKITAYHRKYSYSQFDVAHFVVDFGTTRIVR